MHQLRALCRTLPFRCHFNRRWYGENIRNIVRRLQALFACLPDWAIEMVPSDKSRGMRATTETVKWYMHDWLLARKLGKLVNVVRDYAKKIAVETNAKTIIIDGPPGTGCPVVSSLTAQKRWYLLPNHRIRFPRFETDCRAIGKFPH
jgi:hypothetical protein